MTAKDRQQIGEVLEKYNIQVVPSKTHFILARFTNDRTGKWLFDELGKKGIRIKHFVDVGDENIPTTSASLWEWVRKMIIFVNAWKRF